MRLRAALTIAVMSCAAACGQHQSAVNVDVTGDQLYDHVRLQLKVDAMTPKTFSNASFAPGTPFKATLYVPGDGSRTVQITAQADDGRCVTGRGGPVTGTLDTGTASLVVRAVVPCEPLVPDGGAPDRSVDGGSTGLGGAAAPGTGGGGAGGMGTGGRAGTGGTGMAGTGGAGTGGGNGVGGAGGGGTGGAAVPGTGGAAVPGTGGAAVPGTGGAAVPGTGGAAGVGGGSGGTPACANGMKDNAETDIDCGGGAASAACPRCGEGKACLAGSDCLAGLQCAFGRCRAKYPPIDDSLVAFWPLDTDTKDATANRNDTVTYRSAAAVAGKVGGAYQLGGDGCLIAPSSASLDFTGSTKLTMMAWVNPTPSCASGQDVGIVLNKESSYEMAVSCADRAYQYALLPSTQSGWAWQGSKVLTTGVWHHVAAAWDGTIMRLYVDGALVDGITQTGMLADHGWGLGIGCRSVGGDESTGAVTSFFTGIVDEVAVYKRTLSAQEIASYYNATR